MNKKFKFQKRINFRESDAAGIMFFGNIYSIAHEAFEAFIIEKCGSWGAYFKRRDFLIPIRHTEAEYFKPLIPGDLYEIEVGISKIGGSSFTSHYKVMAGETLHAEAKIVHVILDAKTMRPITGEMTAKTFLNQIFVN